jgi:hypothetical protein
MPLPSVEEARDGLRARLKALREAGQKKSSPSGVGTELSKLIAAMGIKDTGCGSCQVLAAEWDRNGIAWCEANADAMAAKLVERAKKRGWLMRLAVAANELTGGIAAPTSRELIDRAIANAKALTYLTHHG